MGLKFNQVFIATLIIVVCASPAAYAYTLQQFQSVITSDDERVNQVREQEIAQIKLVLSRRFTESKQPDLLLRLAELYVEKYRFYFLKENEIYQKQLQGGFKHPYMDHTTSREELKKATQVCLSILESKISFSKMDEVYYFLGYHAKEVGNDKEAEKYYTRIVQHYPQSHYAPEIYRSLAEDAFNSRKYEQSVALYEKAAQDTSLPSYPRILYKLGWAYFKTRHKEEAFQALKKVVALINTENRFVGLKEEALNDLAFFFAESGHSHQEAHDYFSKIKGGSDIYVQALSKLSKVYEDEGKYVQALAVNSDLLKEHSDVKPDFIYKLFAQDVELFRKVGDNEGEDLALKRLVEYYSRHSDEIAKGEDATVIKLRTQNKLRSRATEIHKEARKEGLKSGDVFSRAADLYGLYIQVFLKNPKTEKEQQELSEIRTYHSDALLLAGRVEEAMGELEHILYEDGTLKRRKEAGTTLLNILIKHLNKAMLQRIPTEDLEKRFLKAASAFEEVFPKDPLVVELEYKKAKLLIEKSGSGGLSEDAQNALSAFVLRYPTRSESVEVAYDLVADEIKKKKNEQALKNAQVFLSNQALMLTDKKGNLKKFLHSVITHQSFENVQALEKKEDYAHAALEYQRLSQSSGANTEITYKALNNAAVDFEKAGNQIEAVRVYEKMIISFPENGLVKKELKRLASTYLWESQFASAAELYAKLSNNTAFSSNERRSFAHISFWLYWGIGDLPLAKTVANRSLHSLCKDFDEYCHTMSLELAQVLKEAGQTQEAINHLKNYLGLPYSTPHHAEAAFMLGQLYERFHENGKAQPFYKKAAQSSHLKSARERNFAAHAAFLMLEPDFLRFKKITLVLPEKKLKARTRQKIKDLESLVKRYQVVLKYEDGEWGLAALERLASAFYSFSQELVAAPVPPGLDSKTLSQYQNEILSIAKSMEKKSMTYLRQGLEKGMQLGVTTITFINLTQRLSVLNPRQYPPAHYVLFDEKTGVSLLHFLGTVYQGLPKELRNPDIGFRKMIGSVFLQNPSQPEPWVEFGNLEVASGRLKLAQILYEQALNLNSKYLSALNNISIIHFMEGHPMEATQGLLEAAKVNGSNKEVGLNLAKLRLGFHHFSKAFEWLSSLVHQFPEDQEIQECLAISELGLSKLAQAGSVFSSLGAKDNKRFSLWYNWSVWALLSDDKASHEDALRILKNRYDELPALEKSQVDVALGLSGSKGKGEHR